MQGVSFWMRHAPMQLYVNLHNHEKMKRQHLIVLLLAVCLCWACGKSYNDVVEMVEDSEQKTDPSSAGQSATDDSQKGEGSDTGQPEGGDGQSGDSGGGSEGDEPGEPGDWEEIDYDRETPYEEPYQGGGEEGSSSQGGSEQGDDGVVAAGSYITVNDFLTKRLGGGVFVNGYIVGACTKNKDYADLTPPFTYATALLLADSPDEKDINKMMSLELKSGSKIRAALNLVDHKELYRHKLQVFGYKEVYLGMYGMKGVGTWAYDW